MTIALRPLAFLSMCSLAGSGCGSGAKPSGGNKGAASAAAAAPSPKAEAPAPGPNRATETPPAKLIDPPRAQAAASVSAKSGPLLQGKFAELAGLYALAGTATEPSWSASGEGAPALVRDDNLDTGWTCTPGGTAPCALGLSLDAPARVTAIGLYAAAGLKSRTYKAHARPKTVRIHTDSGWVDAVLKDGAAHRYITLSASLVTKSLAVEILDVYPGSKGEGLFVAELEVFGPEGPQRSAVEFDPTQALVGFERDTWATEAGSHIIRQVFVGHRDAEGTLKRSLRATATYGQPGSRWVVFEQMYAHDCERGKGKYLLLDKQTRMIASLGDLGGVPGTVQWHPGGAGLMVTSLDATTAKAVFWDGGTLTHHRLKQKSDETPEEMAARLGFTAPPVTRGGTPFGTPGEGCLAGLEFERDPGNANVLEQFTELAGQAGLPEMVSDYISVCSLSSTALALLGTGGLDGRQWFAAVFNGDDTVVAQQSGKAQDLRGLWLHRASEGHVWLETSEQDKVTSTLWHLSELGIDALATPGALAVRRPADCGDEPTDPAENREMAAELPSIDDSSDVLPDGVANDPLTTGSTTGNALTAEPRIPDRTTGQDHL